MERFNPEQRRRLMELAGTLSEGNIEEAFKPEKVDLFWKKIKDWEGKITINFTGNVVACVQDFWKKNGDPEYAEAQWRVARGPQNTSGEYFGWLEDSIPAIIEDFSEWEDFDKYTDQYLEEARQTADIVLEEFWPDMQKWIPSLLLKKANGSTEGWTKEEWEAYQERKRAQKIFNAGGGEDGSKIFNRSSGKNSTGRRSSLTGTDKKPRVTVSEILKEDKNMANFDLKSFMVNEGLTRVARDRSRLLKEDQEEAEKLYGMWYDDYGFPLERFIESLGYKYGDYYFKTDNGHTFNYNWISDMDFENELTIDGKDIGHVSEDEFDNVDWNTAELISAKPYEE